MVDEYSMHLNAADKVHRCHITISNLDKVPEEEQLCIEFVFVDGKLPLWWLLRPVFEQYKL